jgi:3-oxoacid CoA-transferase subunit B
VVNILITDLAVFEIDKNGMTLTELAPDVTLAEIAERTDARYKIAAARAGRRSKARSSQTSL